MLTSESCLGVMIIEFELATSTFLVLSDQSKQCQSSLIMDSLAGEGGGTWVSFYRVCVARLSEPLPLPLPLPRPHCSLFCHQS